MLQLWVWEGATLSATHPDCKAESFLHVGNVVVRRQDTSRARVQVAEPFVGDLRVHRSSILVTCCQAAVEMSVFFGRLSRVRSVNLESCREAEKSISSPSSS